MIFKVSKTYQIITEESAEYGDYEEQGFIYEDQEFYLRDLIREIKNGGFVQNSGRWLSTIDAEKNYKTGAETYYNLHIKTNERNYNRICKLAGIV